MKQQFLAWFTRVWQLALVKFLVVGGLSTLVQFGLLIATVESGLLPPLTASAFGYVLGAMVNYMLNYYFTFNSEQKHSQTLPKFLLVFALGATVNTLSFALANRFLPWYWLSQCIATGASLCANYLLHRFWIYRVAKIDVPQVPLG